MAKMAALLEQIERTVPRSSRSISPSTLEHALHARGEGVPKHPRIKVHFTPASASWLNAVEGWFSLLERRSIHRIFTTQEALRVELRRFISPHNAHSAKPFVWTKSALSILDSVRRAKARS